jgi:molybdate transport system substrate-binding protein
MRQLFMGVCVGAALGSVAASAAEIRIFSAGAVEPGLLRAAEQFKRASGHDIKVQFNTAPQLARKLAAGEVADILIAPPAVLDEQVKSGKIAAEGRVMLGRVGAGVVVRAGGPNPNVATTEALKQAVLGAESLVYNTASTGLYLERLFERMGIAEQIKAKTTRYPNGEAVMEHVMKGKGNELGFGAVTEIKMLEPKGLRLVGPLPAEVQNYTSYGAALMSGATSAEAAKAFLAYLASPAAKQSFVAAGIE